MRACLLNTCGALHKRSHSARRSRAVAHLTCSLRVQPPQKPQAPFTQNGEQEHARFKIAADHGTLDAAWHHSSRSRAVPSSRHSKVQVVELGEREDGWSDDDVEPEMMAEMRQNRVRLAATERGPHKKKRAKPEDADFDVTTPFMRTIFHLLVFCVTNFILVRRVQGAVAWVVHAQQQQRLCRALQPLEQSSVTNPPSPAVVPYLRVAAADGVPLLRWIPYPDCSAGAAVWRLRPHTVAVLSLQQQDYSAVHTRPLCGHIGLRSSCPQLRTARSYAQGRLQLAGLEPAGWGSRIRDQG